MRFYWPIAKLDIEQQMVWGYASTEAEDDQGESVTRAALAAALDDYMRFANIREMHQPSAIGVAKEATVDDRGLYLGAKIVDSDAWQKVIEGVYKGFSIGGRVTARDPADRRLITGLRLTEISVVDRPANPEAVFDCWKLSATAADAAGDDPSETRDYADPGYQLDGRKRYPIDSEHHIRAAWAFIHQPHNARRYTAAQLERIKARIIAAWQATIGPAGPPAAGAPSQGAAETARKGLADIGRLTQIILDLEWLHDRLALEAVAEDDGSPLPQRLRQIIAPLCDFLEALVAEEGSEQIEVPEVPAATGLEALAIAGGLRKARRQDVAPLAAGLATLTGEIVSRLDALQKRVDEIARTPLPPQTIARGFAGVAKREDGPTPAAAGDIVAALARMSEEERTLTLIKAAHAAPIVPGRAAALAAR